MEVKVPDIGDFSDVPVLTVLVSVGDTVAAEDPLIELESDKATMEVEAVEEGARAVVDGLAGDGGVVGVHHPVNKAHRHPRRDQIRLCCADRAQQAQGPVRLRVVPLVRTGG